MTAAAVCMYVNCGQAARFGLSIKLWSAGQPKSKQPSVLAVHGAVCEGHSRELGKVRDWLSHEAKAEINKNFVANKRKAPDYNAAEWELKAIN